MEGILSITGGPRDDTWNAQLVKVLNYNKHKGVGKVSTSEKASYDLRGFYCRKI